MALNRCKNGHMYSARKYGDTCPYCNTEIERVNIYSNANKRTMLDDPDKTMPVMGSEENVDPVTGWLVCIEGSQYGKDYKIHRLVATAFCPNPENKPIVHHKDHDKWNNKASNLVWATQQENVIAYFDYKKELSQL